MIPIVARFVFSLTLNYCFQIPRRVHLLHFRGLEDQPHLACHCNGLWKVLYHLQWYDIGLDKLQNKQD